MSQIGRGGTEKARHWQEVLRAQEASGLSQAAFCRERGIKAGTLAWWKRQLRRDERASAGFNGPARCWRAWWPRASDTAWTRSRT